MLIYKSLRPLLSSCTTEQVHRVVWTKRGWISLAASRELMMQFHQPELLSRTIQNVLPTKLGSSGDSQLSLTQRSAVQPTGGGLRLERRGRYIGQLFHLLRQAVRSWPSVPARRAATGRCKCFRTGLSCTALCSCVCAWALNTDAGTLIVAY